MSKQILLCEEDMLSSVKVYFPPTFGKYFYFLLYNSLLLPKNLNREEYILILDKIEHYNSV